MNKLRHVRTLAMGLLAGALRPGAALAQTRPPAPPAPFIPDLQAPAGAPGASEAAFDAAGTVGGAAVFAPCVSVERMNKQP